LGCTVWIGTEKQGEEKMTTETITMPEGAVVEIDRAYVATRKEDRMAAGNLQHFLGRAAIVTPKLVGRYRHSGRIVLIAAVVTVGRRIVDNYVWGF
jgi:hypothetical protein